MNVIGYAMIAGASALLAKCGLTLDRWETWVIMLGYILGCGFVYWSD